MCTRSAMSGQFVRPMGIAPAAFIRSTIGRVDGRDRVGEGRHPVVGRAAREIDVLLHGERDAVQRPEWLTRRQRRVCGAGGGSRLVAEDAGDRVEVRVDVRDAREIRVDHLRGGGFLARDDRRQLGGSLLPELGHGGDPRTVAEMLLRRRPRS